MIKLSKNIRIIFGKKNFGYGTKDHLKSLEKMELLLYIDESSARTRCCD